MDGTMLSKKSTAILDWIASQKKPLHLEEIQRDCPDYDKTSFRKLLDCGYVEAKLSLDEEGWCVYRVSPDGEAFSEKQVHERWISRREWLTALLPVATFLAGLFASDPVKSGIKWLINLIKELL